MEQESFVDFGVRWMEEQAAFHRARYEILAPHFPVHVLFSESAGIWISERNPNGRTCAGLMRDRLEMFEVIRRKPNREIINRILELLGYEERITADRKGVYVERGGERIALPFENARTPGGNFEIGPHRYTIPLNSAR
jgi:hypothetical protein